MMERTALELYSQPQTVVRGEAVRVVAGDTEILHGCDFSFARGQATAILGPNGAGKSTLLGLCNGLVRCTSGCVEVFGETLSPKNARTQRKRIGYVAQWRAIDPRQPISVFDSVLSGTYGRLGILRRPGRNERDAATAALAAVGAERLADRPLGHLSGGEAQRVAIARALAQNPELLLLDEPTASLDWQSRREILQLVRELKERFALSILMVTHEFNSLEGLCDKVFFMKGGSVFWQGPVREALDAALLSEVYSAHVEVRDTPDGRVVLL